MLTPVEMQNQEMWSAIQNRVALEIDGQQATDAASFGIYKAVEESIEKHGLFSAVYQQIMEDVNEDS